MQTNNNLGKPTLVDNIISNVKEKMNNNLRIYLIVVVPILCFLAYIFYKYNVDSRTNNVIKNMDYKSQLELQPMIPCYNTDKTQQYKLCDYYISSSFMTPCVGNQHYDYVSNNMIEEVIKSGARYIQIPICESDVSNMALPVVGTAVYGQQLITSLNTLEIKSVLKTIRSNVFKFNNKPINYPLIIHLVLNTFNAFTLRTLADNIAEILGDVLIDASKYITFPIFLEKLCNLQGKIILFATPEYIGTKLEPYIVPTNKLFEIYHFSELGPLNMSSDTVYENPYNKKLSSKQQEASNAKFKAKYPSIDYIIKNSDNIGNTIMNDKDILDNLTCFNKVGMTIIKPHYPEDVISKNYDSAESIFYGCQITAMNFQINDINMKNYLTIFKDSSFRLKPDSLRFSEVETPAPDLLKLYQSISEPNNNVLNNFFYKYNNCLIAIESYSLLNTYLTQIETNLRFNVAKTIGNNKTQDGKVQYNIRLNQCFIPRKSKINSGNNISIYLESASLPNKFITFNSGLFNLDNLAKKTKDLMSQALYIENPKIRDNEIDGEKVSIRLVDDKNPKYIAFENKLVKAYSNIIQVEAQTNMTFIIHKMPFKYVVKFLTIYDGSFKTMGGNIIGVVENNTRIGTLYYAIPANSTSNFDIFKDQFVLQNKQTKKYVSFDPNTFFLYDKEISPTTNSIFNIENANGYYKILNINNQNLILQNRKIIKFANEKNITTNANLFKINITYELE